MADPDPIAAALATKPTARGRWILEPTQEDDPPPELTEGEEYVVVRLETGEVTEGILGRTPKDEWGFDIDGGDTLDDVAAVWLPSRSGSSLTPEQRRANGQKLVQGLWLPAELVDALDAECGARGMTRTSAVEGALRNWLYACKQARK